MTTEPVNMYQMLGFTYADVAAQAHREYGGRNLAEMGDKKARNLEERLLEFVGKEILQLPNYDTNVFGIVTRSGTESNAEMCHVALPYHRSIFAVLGDWKYGINSNLSHKSIKEGYDTIGVNIEIPADDNDSTTLDVDPLLGFQVRPECLEEFSKQPQIVTLTLGTTYLGNLDFHEFCFPVLERMQEKGAWIHLDASAGAYYLLPHYEKYRKIIELANSITFNPHKFVGEIGCSTLFVRDLIGQNLKKKLQEHYNPATNYFHSWAPQLGTTRPAYNAATAYLMMQRLGIDDLKELIAESNEKAHYVSDECIRAGIPLINPVQSHIVPIAAQSATHRDALVAALETQGFLVSPVALKGIDAQRQPYEFYGIRVAVTAKPEMTWKNIRGFTAALKKVYHQTV